MTSEAVTITGKTAGLTGVTDIGGVKVADDTVLKAAVAPQKITVTVHADGSAPEFKVAEDK